MKDLFGNEVLEPIDKLKGNTDKHKYRKARGWAAQPGSGPEGETCKSCKNSYIHHRQNGKNWWKCALLKPTHGAATDLRLKWTACNRWEQLDENP